MRRPQCACDDRTDAPDDVLCTRQKLLFHDPEIRIRVWDTAGPVTVSEIAESQQFNILADFQLATLSHAGRRPYCLTRT